MQRPTTSTSLRRSPRLDSLIALWSIFACALRGPSYPSDHARRMTPFSRRLCAPLSFAAGDRRGTQRLFHPFGTVETHLDGHGCEGEMIFPYPCASESSVVHPHFAFLILHFAFCILTFPLPCHGAVRPLIAELWPVSDRATRPRALSVSTDAGRDVQRARSPMARGSVMP